MNSYKEAGKALFILAKSFDGIDTEKSAVNGEWSISKIVHHLFDAEAFFVTRYLNILVYTKPGIILFDEELLPAALQYEKRNIESSLNGLIGIHAAMEDLLLHISPRDWQRTGIHPDLGQISLSQVLAQQTSHISEHVAQINEILLSGL